VLPPVYVLVCHLCRQYTVYHRAREAPEGKKYFLKKAVLAGSKQVQSKVSLTLLLKCYVNEILFQLLGVKMGHFIGKFCRQNLLTYKKTRYFTNLIGHFENPSKARLFLYLV
jgi:hypothetical protein